MAAEDNGVSALSFIANELNAFYTRKGDLLDKLLRPMVAAAAHQPYTFLLIRHCTNTVEYNDYANS